MHTSYAYESTSKEDLLPLATTKKIWLNGY